MNLPRALAAFTVAALAFACDGPGEAAPDSGPEPEDWVFEAPADPSESTRCETEAPAVGVARAKHIVCDAELLEGALAMGRAGDLVLENSLARFVIRTGDEAASTIGGPSGGLIDAAPRGGADLIKEILPLIELSSISPTDIVVVDAGGDDEARVRVLFDVAPIGLVETAVPGLARPVSARGQLDYVLGGSSRALRIEVSLTTTAGSAATLAASGLLALLGAQETVQSGYGVLDEDRIGGAGSTLVGERQSEAFAIHLQVEPAALVHVDTIHLLRGPRAALTRGALATWVAEVAVADTAALAYEAVHAEEGLALLRVRGVAGDRVEVSRDGAPSLRTRFDASGLAQIPLHAGDYDLRAGFDGFFEAPPERVTLPLRGLEHTLMRAPAATLRIEASADGDDAAPVRVTCTRDAEELLRFVAIGPTERRFPPGSYHADVSHGMEFDVDARDVTLVEGETLTLTTTLDRVLDTTGWASVDLHLHSELSTDSSHRAEDALRMVAAEGLDAAVSSDHDFLTDYPGLARRAGVEGRVVFAIGEEVSTTHFGHVNGYPLRRDPSRAGAGAVVWFERAPADVFAALRALGDESAGGALVQINHPRLGDAAFFTATGLDLDTGRALADPASLGLPADTVLDDYAFDVVEVWNGYTRGDNERAFEDYLALFAAGRRFTMVGNSDTHRADLPAGSPRSFVRVADDTPAGLTFAEIRAGLLSREVSVAAGIFVTAAPEGPRAGGVVPLRVRVQAPPWVEAGMLRIYVGRSVVIERAVPPIGSPLRLDEVIDVPMGIDDDFVVVRVDGARAPRPFQHFAPYGVTNPIEIR